MINFLMAVTLILVVAILIIHIIRIMNEAQYINKEVDDEVVTTTTTTTTTVETTQPTIDQLPELKRQHKPNGQPFVIDPVDGDEWMLNTNDDMYEDGAGKWWRLV
jgi:hypothetical protein